MCWMKKKRYCKYWGKCGGCDFVNIPYSTELAEKYLVETHFLSRFAHVERVLGAPKLLSYRCKIQSVCGEYRKNLVTGIYKRGTHQLFAVQSCPLEDARASKILSLIKSLAKNLALRAYDEDRKKGDLRHVLIRTSSFYDEALVVLVVSDCEKKEYRELAAELSQKLKFIKSISLVENKEKTSMVIPENAREKIIFGDGFIRERICNLDFRISSLSFFQINPKMAEKLYEQALMMADLREGETIIDAYSGTGTIALIAASRARNSKVIAIEANADAVRMAKENAALNKIEDVSFITNDASAELSSMARRKEECSLLILDPPRAGSSEQFLAAAKRMNPERIVYISCNPETLARDLRYIYQNTEYRAKKIQPVDMFPASRHIETVVLLAKRQKKKMGTKRSPSAFKGKSSVSQGVKEPR